MVWGRPGAQESPTNRSRRQSRRVLRERGRIPGRRVRRHGSDAATLRVTPRRRGCRCALWMRVETGTTPELGVLPAARLRRAVPAGGRRSKPSPRFFVVGDPRSRCASQQRCRVSRSRAMPVGDRRSAFSWLAMRDLAARRAAVPGFALPRDAGRRPALRFFAVGDARSRCASRSGAGFRAPARCRSETGAPLFRGWRSAISRRVAQRCRVSRSRAMPVGDRRSAFSRLAIRDLAARRSSGAGFRAPARCRSETGAPLFSRLAMRDLAARRAAVPGFALPRDAGRRPALRFFVVGDARSRCFFASRAAVPGFALPRDAGRRPALRFVAVGDARSRGASRSGAGVSRSRAMPVGDRRSFAVGDAPSGQLGSPGARGIRKKPS